MALTSSEAFKVGFLARCVEEGLSATQIAGRVKEAMDKTALLKEILGHGVDIAKGLGGAALGWGIPLAAVAPPALGALGGFGLAKATDIDDTDVDEIKDKEVLDEYQRQTRRLQRQKAVRDYQQARQRTGRIFG